LKRHGRRIVISPGILYGTLAAVLAVLLLIGIMGIVGSGNDVESAQESTAGNTVHEDGDSVSSAEPIAFPFVLENGLLTVESVFQFSGPNPDAGMQNVTDIAAVLVGNSSERYLDSAEIRVTLQSGAERTFTVSDIPAGTTAMAFSSANEKLSESDACVGISAKAAFMDVKEISGLAVTVEGAEITLQNNSGEDLEKIDVYCREFYNESFFGGSAYTYTIPKIAAGERAVVVASECILGSATVVRIAVNNQK